MARNTVAVLLLSLGSLHAATVSVEPSSNNVSVGQTFDVSVDVASVTDLYAFQFDLGYDPTILSAVNVTEGPFLPSGGSTFFIPGSIDNNVGTVTGTADSLIGAIPGVTGGGVLVNIEFQALATGSSPISLSNVTLLDSNLSDIGSTSADGSVTVGSVSSVPEPRLTSLLLIVGLIVAGLTFSSRGSTTQRRQT
jgi:hypothetical protein